MISELWIQDSLNGITVAYQPDQMIPITDITGTFPFLSFITVID